MSFEFSPGSGLRLPNFPVRPNEAGAFQQQLGLPVQLGAPFSAQTRNLAGSQMSANASANSAFSFQSSLLLSPHPSMYGAPMQSLSAPQHLVSNQSALGGLGGMQNPNLGGLNANLASQSGALPSLGATLSSLNATLPNLGATNLSGLNAAMPGLNAGLQNLGGLQGAANLPGLNPTLSGLNPGALSNLAGIPNLGVSGGDRFSMQGNAGSLSDEAAVNELFNYPKMSYTSHNAPFSYGGAPFGGAVQPQQPTYSGSPFYGSPTSQRTNVPAPQPPPQPPPPPLGSGMPSSLGGGGSPLKSAAVSSSATYGSTENMPFDLLGLDTHDASTLFGIHQNTPGLGMSQNPALCGMQNSATLGGLQSGGGRHLYSAPVQMQPSSASSIDNDEAFLSLYFDATSRFAAAQQFPTVGLFGQTTPEFGSAADSLFRNDPSFPDFDTHTHTTQPQPAVPPQPPPQPTPLPSSLLPNAPPQSQPQQQPQPQPQQPQQQPQAQAQSQIQPQPQPQVQQQPQAQPQQQPQSLQSQPQTPSGHAAAHQVVQQVAQQSSLLQSATAGVNVNAGASGTEYKKKYQYYHDSARNADDAQPQQMRPTPGTQHARTPQRPAPQVQQQQPPTGPSGQPNALQPSAGSYTPTPSDGTQPSLTVSTSGQPSGGAECRFVCTSASPTKLTLKIARRKDSDTAGGGAGSAAGAGASDSQTEMNVPSVEPAPATQETTATVAAQPPPATPTSYSQPRHVKSIGKPSYAATGVLPKSNSSNKRKREVDSLKDWQVHDPSWHQDSTTPVPGDESTSAAAADAKRRRATLGTNRPPPEPEELIAVSPGLPQPTTPVAGTSTSAKASFSFAVPCSTTAAGSATTPGGNVSVSVSVADSAAKKRNKRAKQLGTSAPLLESATARFPTYKQTSAAPLAEYVDEDECATAFQLRSFQLALDSVLHQVDSIDWRTVRLEEADDDMMDEDAEVCEKQRSGDVSHVPPVTLVPRSTIAQLCAETAKLKAAGALQQVGAESLRRFVMVLACNVRDGFKLRPTSSNGANDAASEARASKKRPTKKRRNSTTSDANSATSEVEDEAETEDAPDLEPAPETDAMRRERRLWNALLDERVLRASDAALCALHVLTAANLPRVVLVDEAITLCVNLVHFQLRRIAYPHYDPLFDAHAARLTAASLAADSARLESAREAAASSKKDKRKPAASASAVAASRRKLERERERDAARRRHARFASSLVDQLYAKAGECVHLLAELLRLHVLPDRVILKCAALAVEPFFVDNVHELQLNALKLLTNIFGLYPRHRHMVIDDIFTSLPRLVSNASTSGGAASLNKRTFRLLNRDAHIQMLSALLLQLVQSVISLRDDRLRMITGDDASGQSGVKGAKGDALFGVEEEDDERSGAVTAQPSNRVEPGAKAAGSGSEYHDMELSLTSSFEDALKIGHLILSQFLKRCTVKNTAADEDYRPFFDRFVQDLLVAFNQVEWPAAELLLNILTRLLEKHLATLPSGSTPSQPQPATAAANAPDANAAGADAPAKKDAAKQSSRSREVAAQFEQQIRVQIIEHFGNLVARARREWLAYKGVAEHTLDAIAACRSFELAREIDRLRQRVVADGEPLVDATPSAMSIFTEVSSGSGSGTGTGAQGKKGAQRSDKKGDRSKSDKAKQAEAEAAAAAADKPVPPYAETCTHLDRLFASERLLAQYLVVNRTDDCVLESACTFYYAVWLRDAALEAQRSRAKLTQAGHSQQEWARVVQGNELEQFLKNRLFTLVGECSKGDTSGAGSRGGTSGGVSLTRGPAGTAMVDAADAERLVLFLSGQRNFIQLFDYYVATLLRLFRDESIQVRTKAVRALCTLIEVDPTTLQRPDVETAVHSRLADSAISVREATIDLMGRFMLQHPKLVSQYLSMLSERVLDTGVSVRKRVIKIFRDVCASPAFDAAEYDRMPAICVRVIRRIDDDESVRKLVLDTFAQLWFTPVALPPDATAGTSRCAPLVRKCALIVKVVHECRTQEHEAAGSCALDAADSSMELFEQLISALLNGDPRDAKPGASTSAGAVKPEPDAADEKPAASRSRSKKDKRTADSSVLGDSLAGEGGPAGTALERSRLAELASQQVVDALVGRLVEARSGEQLETVTCLAALHLFAKVRPTYLVRYVDTVHMYVTAECPPSSPTSLGDAQYVVAYAAQILERALPRYDHPNEHFISRLEEHLTKLLLVQSPVLLKHCMACLATIVHRISRNYALVFDCFAKYFHSLNAFHKQLSAALRTNALPVALRAAVPPESRPRLLRALYTAGLFCKYFDFDSKRHIVKAEPRTANAADSAKLDTSSTGESGVTESTPCVVRESVLQILLFFASLRSADDVLRAADTLQIRRKALSGLGFVLTNSAYSKLITRADVKKCYRDVLTSREEHHTILDLKIQVLSNLYEFLVEEERRLLEADSEYRRMREAAENAASGSSVMHGRANPDDAAGDGTIKKFDLKQIYDTQCGVSSTVVQTYIGDIQSSYLDADSQLRHVDAKLIVLVLRQGLMHPATLIANVVAMTTDPEVGIRLRAEMQLSEIEQRYPGFVHMKALPGLKLSFRLHLLIAQARSASSILQRSTGPLYVRGKVDTTGPPLPSISGASGSAAHAHTADTASTTTFTALNHSLYTILRSNRQHRRSFLLSLLAICNEHLQNVASRLDTRPQSTPATTTGTGSTTATNQTGTQNTPEATTANATASGTSQAGASAVQSTGGNATSGQPPNQANATQGNKISLSEVVFVCDNLAAFPYQVLDEPLFVLHHLDRLLALYGTNLLKFFKRLLHKYFRAERRVKTRRSEKTTSDESESESSGDESAKRESTPAAPGDVSQSNPGNFDDETQNGSDSAEQLTTAERLRRDLDRVEQFIADSVDGCVALLLLKQHLLGLHSISEAKLSKYTPHEIGAAAGGAKVWDKPLSARNGKLHTSAPAAASYLFLPDEQLCSFRTQTVPRSSVRQRKQLVMKTYATFKKLMQTVDTQQAASDDDEPLPDSRKSAAAAAAAAATAAANTARPSDVALSSTPGDQPQQAAQPANTQAFSGQPFGQFNAPYRHFSVAPPGALFSTPSYFVPPQFAGAQPAGAQFGAQRAQTEVIINHQPPIHVDGGASSLKLKIYISNEPQAVVATGSQPQSNTPVSVTFTHTTSAGVANSAAGSSSANQQPVVPGSTKQPKSGKRKKRRHPSASSDVDDEADDDANADPDFCV